MVSKTEKQKSRIGFTGNILHVGARQISMRNAISTPGQSSQSWQRSHEALVFVSG
jgi:hypothetical protein